MRNATNANQSSTRLSTDQILLSAVAMVGNKHRLFPALHLDIGSGSGDLIALLRSKFEVSSQACDYTTELMHQHDVHVDVVNLNLQDLPYPDHAFDIVTCTEVIEHLENYRKTLREAYRVLKPDGTLVVTTPNILNLKSRVRFMVYGFFNLFGPLHFRESKLYSTGGHITPIGAFYLVHALVDAGFQDIKIQIDKRQSTSLFWLFFLYLPIKFFSMLTSRYETAKYQTIDSLNKGWVEQINSVELLLGRTLIVGAKKQP